MKKIIISIVIMFATCKSPDIFDRSTEIGSKDLKMKATWYHNESEDELKFTVDTNGKYLYHLCFDVKKGRLVHFGSVENVFNSSLGKFYMSFLNGKPYFFCFKDSLGHTTGPAFVFKKNGSLKHLFIYDSSGNYKETYYSSRPKKIFSDTLLFGKAIRNDVDSIKQELLRKE